MSTTAQSLSSFATTIKKTVQLFQPELLRTENGRENAQISLKALARTCQEGDPKYHLAFLEGLLVSEIGVLEYIYAKDSNVARIIRVIVLAEHSANDPSCENAMWYRTLLRLDDFYLRLPPTIEFPNYQKLANSQQIAMKYRQTGLRKNSFDYMDEMARLKSIVKFYLETLADIAQTLVTMYEQEPPKEQPNQDPPEMDTVPPTDLPESVAVGLQDEVKSPSEHIKRHPLRAAALFDAGSGQLGHWPILFSSKGYSHWRQLGTADAAIHKIVHRKITELSFGFFSNDNQRHLAGEENEVPVFTARLTGDRFLIYQIECGFPPSTDVAQVDLKYDTQMIRIYGIYNHAQIRRQFWSALARQSRKLGREYRKRCIRRASQTTIRGHQVIPPLVFSDVLTIDTEDGQNKDSFLPLSHEESLLLHSVLALEKYVPYSQQVFNACRNNEELTSVFAVSREEEKIIYYPSSTLVIGRSGTGKTTTMIFKMLALEKAATLSGTRLRQVFVTQSPVLAKRVATFYNKYKSHSIAPVIAEDFSILDLVDEVVETESDLPAGWCDLKDEDFPLFVTFEQLCQLLQSDIAPEFKKTALGGEKKPITFDMFLGDFWPHFNQQLKKGLDASLVWSEFMGVIKGSEQSLSTSRGYVSRETYEAMTTKSGLSVARSRVYGLFESYLKQKKVDMYDIPERTHVLIKAIDSIGLMGLSVDYLYVDEVQDNLLLDVCLLRKLCRYPEGLFWAGDSAQTIAVGSSFRFNELTAYLYRAEMSDRAVRNNQRSPVHPQLFELAVNYRSQGGIVNAAASLVEKIIKFFPRSIDLLSKERSKVDGPKPVIFSPVSGSQLQLENFLFGKADAKVEFGAEQVILVRNDAARDKLVEKLGDLALVLTLYESKGLEFNDVLLYDFFEDSPATAADWRVVLNCLDEDNVLAPRFDEIRHAVLQTELKFLYVGLTRAQNRVWIWDTSEKINAMMMLWKTQDLATVQAPEDVSEQIAVQSSKRAWEKRACSLFQQKLYQQSIFAFKKADKPLECMIAEGFQSRSLAERMPSADSQRPAAWRLVGTKFDQCQRSSSMHVRQQRRLRILAAECYAEIPDHHLAAELFELAESFTRALQHYRQAGRFDDAITLIGKHEEDIDPTVVKRTLTVAKVFYTKQGDLEKARSLFKSPKDHARFLDNLGLDGMLTEVLEDMKRYDDAAEVAERNGDELQAARLHFQSPRDESKYKSLKVLLRKLWKEFTLEAPSFSNDSEVEEAIRMAQSIKKGDPVDKQEVAMFSAILRQDHQHLSTLIPHLLKAARTTAAILSAEHLFRLRGYSIRPQEGATKVDQEDKTGVKTSALKDVITIVDIYSAYCAGLRSIILHPHESLRDSQIQKLLHFLPVKSAVDDQTHEYIILRSATPVLDITHAKETPEGMVITENNMQRVLVRSLSHRYNERIRDLQYLIGGARALRPCSSYVISQSNCAPKHKDAPKCPNDHIDRKTAAANFPLRVRVVIRVMALLDSMMPDATTSSGSEDEMTLIIGKKNMQRIWLDRLFQTLYPVYSGLGSLHTLDKEIFREHASWLHVVQAWLKARLFLMRPVEKHINSYLTNILNVALLGSGLDRQNFRSYSARIRCSRYPDSKHYQNFENPLLHAETGVTVVREMFSCLRGSWERGFQAGMRSLRHIIAHPELPVDIHALITFVERIITLAAFSLASSRAQHQPLRCWNSILLPKTWVIHGLTQKPAKAQTRDLPIETLIVTIGLIMKRMAESDRPHQDDRVIPLSSTTASSFTYQSLPFGQTGKARVPYGLRCIFRARLCYALVILGCNTDRTMQDRIVKLFRSMTEFRPHELYARFVQCKSWNDLTLGMRESQLNVPSDGICQLFLQSGNQKMIPVRGITHILFRSRDDLFSQIGFWRSPISLGLEVPAVSTSATHIEVAPSLPTQGAEDMDEDIEAESPEADDDKLIKASEVIATAYKRHLQRQASNKTGNHFFDTCLTQLSKDGRETIDRQYRKYFLGPLPHLLSWLEEALKVCAKTLKQQSRILGEASHEEYDRAFEMIDRLKHLGRELLRISKQLSPNSGFHTHNSPWRLIAEAQCVLPLKTRVESLLPILSSGAAEDFRQARILLRF